MVYFFLKAYLFFFNIDALLALPFVERSQHLLAAFVVPDLSEKDLAGCLERAFNFLIPLKKIHDHCYCLELFHGPTLAFKDFGARFMAQCVRQLQHKERIVIVTATSGDTGAAVANAFFDLPGIDIVVLYPKGKVSQLQEKLFTTLGKNIHAIAIEGTFDACQYLVKQAFDDHVLRRSMTLTSANSINIGRLLAQICYYFEALAQVPYADRAHVVLSVPCGNFGNLTAGLMAHMMGLPVQRFIAATNSNDTVPRYLATQHWQPKDTIVTLSNAMDVSQPNNWPRVEVMRQLTKNIHLESVAINEQQTVKNLSELYERGYLSEPHAVVAYCGLQRYRREQETGIFLGTAHPAKFKEEIDALLGQEMKLPDVLAKCCDQPSVFCTLPAQYVELKKFLLSL